MNFKKFSLIITILCFLLLNTFIVYATYENNQTLQNIFRIHIVANSDSIDDQIIKYNVAKKVEEYIQMITVNSQSKEESKQIIEENIYNILELCDKTLKELDCDHACKAQIGNILYEAKSKDNIHMKSGIYNSLNIIIGNGNRTKLVVVNISNIH